MECRVLGHDSRPETTIATENEFFKIGGKAVAVVGSLCASNSCKDHCDVNLTLTYAFIFFVIYAKFLPWYNREQVSLH